MTWAVLQVVAIGVEDAVAVELVLLESELDVVVLEIGGVEKFVEVDVSVWTGVDVFEKKPDVVTSGVVVFRNTPVVVVRVRLAVEEVMVEAEMDEDNEEEVRRLDDAVAVDDAVLVRLG